VIAVQQWLVQTQYQKHFVTLVAKAATSTEDEQVLVFSERCPGVKDYVSIEFYPAFFLV